MKIFGKTDKGMKRKNNEDNFYVDEKLGLMIVADGMGGHNSGEVASKLATSICSEQLKRSLQSGHVPVFYKVPRSEKFDDRSFLLGDCFKFSNVAVFEAGQSSPKNQNMGTTLVGALLLDDKMAIANVGDSRLYTYTARTLTQQTVDHSFVQEQLSKGIISEEDAEKSEMKNLLTRSIGVSENVDVDIKELNLSECEYILLCSDGLTKMMTDKEIENVFKQFTDPSVIAETLIKTANEKGGTDNVTAVVAHVQGDASPLGSLKDRVKNIFKKKQGPTKYVQTHC